MKYILLVMSLLAFFDAVNIFVTAASAIHQILGAIMMVVASVLFVGMAIVRAFDKTIDYAKDEVDKELGKNGRP